MDRDSTTAKQDRSQHGIALTSAALAFDPEDISSVVGPAKPRTLGVLGPGLITGASDDDPSGIATYSQAGAGFGYALSWMLLYSIPLMVAVQMIAARIGRTTGHGIAGVLRLHAPAWVLQWIVVLLLVANTINLGADLGAMADATTLLLPDFPRWLGVVCFGVICICMQLFLVYASYARVLKWLTLAMFMYFAALATAHVNWSAFVSSLAWPRVELTRDGLSMIVAILGTTISPYLFFWQASEEVEDLKAFPRRRDLMTAPEQGERALHRIEIDTITGMVLSNLIALAIIATTAATLNVAGLTDIQTSAQAAEALTPIAGRFAGHLFATGVIGVGLLAVPVLAGSSAYAIGEARRWPVGFSRRLQEARAFYAVITISTLVGVAICLTPSIDPIKALLWAAILNGIIAVPVLVAMMLAATRPTIMGRFVLGYWLTAFGWLTVLVMAAAVGGMLTLSLV
jgi:NRAMP (natural resistance-associated macrophage protein)-like metal ion transporter